MEHDQNGANDITRTSRHASLGLSVQNYEYGTPLQIICFMTLTRPTNEKKSATVIQESLHVSFSIKR